MPVGVTTRKKTIPITMGVTIIPNNKPNFIQSLFRGVKKLEFMIPKNKKTEEISIDHILYSPSLSIGQIPIIKNTTKNNIPKLLFEG